MSKDREGKGKWRGVKTGKERGEEGREEGVRRWRGDDERVA
jgi:hypothetical protein